MPGQHIELHAVNRITIGTVGPVGQRTFLLQASDAVDMVTLKLEKEQARALGETANELLENLEQDYPREASPFDQLLSAELSLREPTDPLFAIGQIGLGYDDDRDMVVLVVQELLFEDEEDPSTVRLWLNRAQLKALSDVALEVVSQGRLGPKSNGQGPI